LKFAHEISAFDFWFSAQHKFKPLWTLSYALNDVLRTIKEISSYDKEIKDQSAKIQKMKDESKDSHDIKQQVSNREAR
jgi:hypothetical protein